MSPRLIHRVGPSRPVRPSRGTALIVVLAVLVLVTTALTTAATQAGRVAAARSRGEARAALDDLAAEGERLAAAWLDRSAGTAALPPNVLEPRFDVLDDAWMVDGRRWSLRLTAWDQSGMVPLTSLTRATSGRTGTSLAAALPVAMAGAAADLAAIRAPRGSSTGLDQVRLDAAAIAAGVRVFPDPGAPRLDPGGWTDPRRGAEGPAKVATPPSGGALGPSPASGSDWFARPGVFAGKPDSSPAARPPAGSAAGPALGALVATHHAAGRPRINIATAPASLVAAACRAAGLDEERADAILRARAAGTRPSAIGAGGRTVAPSDRGSARGQPSNRGNRSSRGQDSSRGRSAAAVELLTSSDAWAFRVDVARGDLRRSWWLVFRRSTDRAGNATWRKVQQLAIDA